MAANRNPAKEVSPRGSCASRRLAGVTPAQAGPTAVRMTADPGAGRGAVHPTVAKAFHVLDETGLPWVLLRGEDDLALPSGDVDILVARELLPDLDKLMNGIGLCRVHATGHGSHRFYFGY